MMMEKKPMSPTTNGEEQRVGQMIQDYPNSPGVTALQLTLQPVIVLESSVLNTRLTMLLVLLISAGKELPQLFSIKVVPSPSVIVRWS